MPRSILILLVLYATGLAVSTLASSATANFVIVESEVTAPESLPNYIKTLLQAQSFDSSAVGVAAVKTPTYQAFEEAIAAGDSISEEIEYLWQKGTPAGRLYAALLMLNIDRSSGERALKQLREEEITVTRYSGCSMMDMPMSQAVMEVLQERNLEVK